MKCEYEYEQEREDGSLKNWTLLYEIERPFAGSRDEPPSGGVATIFEIKHEDGSKLPDDSWKDAGFDEAEIERLESLCYESWADAEGAAYEDAMEQRADARRERELDREHEPEEETP